MRNKIAQNENPIKKSFDKKPSFDSSDRKKGLNELDEQLNLLMVNTDECLLVVDKNLDIVTCNHKFQELYEVYFGITIVKGVSILSYVQPDRVEIVGELYMKVLAGEANQTEIQVPAPDGSVCFFLNKFKPIYNSNR